MDHIIYRDYIVNRRSFIYYSLASKERQKVAVQCWRAYTAYYYTRRLGIGQFCGGVFPGAPMHDPLTIVSDRGVSPTSAELASVPVSYTHLTLPTSDLV